MTLKEFLENNPEAVKEASNCQTVAEFKELTQKAGITFDSEEKLNKAFNLVKNQNVNELSDDALDAVSGGVKIYRHSAASASYNPATGTWITTGKGKKIAR